jgi:hypothetical protein
LLEVLDSALGGLVARPAVPPAGKYIVDVRGGQGVQVGNQTTQHNVFNAAPDG